MLSAVSGQYSYPPQAKPYPEAPWMPQHGAATAVQAHAHALATQQAMMTAQMAAHAAHAAQVRLIPASPAVKSIPHLLALCYGGGTRAHTRTPCDVPRALGSLLDWWARHRAERRGRVCVNIGKNLFQAAAMSQAAGVGAVDTTAAAAAMSQAGASMAPEVFQAAYAAAFYAQQSRTAMMMGGMAMAPPPASHHHPSQAAAMMSALMGGAAPGMMPGMMPGMPPGMPMFPMPGMMPQAEGAAGGGVGGMLRRGEEQQRGEGRVHREMMMSSGREMRRENGEKGERRDGGGKKQGRERRSARLERGEDPDRGGGGGGGKRERERERGSGRERGRDKEKGGSGSSDPADSPGDHGELLDADGRVRFTSLQEVAGQVSLRRSTASFPLGGMGEGEV